MDGSSTDSLVLTVSLSDGHVTCVLKVIHVCMKHPHSLHTKEVKMVTGKGRTACSDHI